MAWWAGGWYIALHRQTRLDGHAGTYIELRKYLVWHAYTNVRTYDPGTKQCTPCALEGTFLSSFELNFAQMPRILRESWPMPSLTNNSTLALFSATRRRIGFCVIWPVLIRVRVRVGNTFPVSTRTPSVYKKSPYLYTEPPLYGNSREFPELGCFRAGEFKWEFQHDFRPRDFPLWEFQVSTYSI